MIVKRRVKKSDREGIKKHKQVESIRRKNEQEKDIQLSPLETDI